MEVIDFSIDELQKYTMWFMLDEIKQGPIKLVRRTPAGDEIFTDFSCFKMNDDHILLGINHFMKFTAKHNLVAIHEDIEEVVNLQMFENIMDYYDVPIENLDKGYFVFVDSIVIAPEEEWRCDNTRFGPLSHAVAEGIEETQVKGFDQLLTYETILSVEGVGHLIYLHFKDDAEYRNYYANSAKLPISGVTISEAFKLITEWATVAEEPFNNQQDISKDAKDFINKLNFDTSLVDYQVDMYVAEFLKGNPDARMRPQNVQPLSQELDAFIKKNMSYRCLSALISLYPHSWDLQEIIDKEKSELELVHDAFMNRSKMADKPVALNIFTRNVDATMRLHEKIKTMRTF